jgi:hypothetical protein
MSVPHLSTCPRVCYKVMPHVIFLFVQIAQVSAIKPSHLSQCQQTHSFSANSHKHITIFSLLLVKIKIQKSEENLRSSSRTSHEIHLLRTLISSILHQILQFTRNSIPQNPHSPQNSFNFTGNARMHKIT